MPWYSAGGRLQLPTAWPSSSTTKRACPAARFQDVDRQRIVEIDLRGLAAHALAEAGAAMIGVPFQVQRIVQPAQHLGLAGAGHAAQHQEIAFGDGPVQRIQQEAAHGLVAAGHARIGDAGLVAQPLLHDLRTQAAPEAIQVAVRMRLRERGPGVETGRLDGAADQPVPQLDGGLLATLLVADADQLALFVGHQRQIHHAGNAPWRTRRARGRPSWARCRGRDRGSCWCLRAWPSNPRATMRADRETRDSKPDARPALAPRQPERGRPATAARAAAQAS